VVAKTPKEVLWTLHVAGRKVYECRLVGRGAHGYEVQLYRNGRSYRTRRFDGRESAVAFADGMRAGFMADGWQELKGDAS
jgi:hypothetical protein